MCEGFSIGDVVGQRLVGGLVVLGHNGVHSRTRTVLAVAFPAGRADGFRALAVGHFQVALEPPTPSVAGSSAIEGAELFCDRSSVAPEVVVGAGNTFWQGRMRS